MAEREVAICVFPNLRVTEPIRNSPVPWAEVVSIHARHHVRPGKSGPLIGGYQLSGTRKNENVVHRSLIQLDIDTEGTKDLSGRIATVTRAAPPFDSLRPRLADYEWIAASSHWHEPKRGIHKYRVTLLPDRDIKPDEWLTLLEGLDDLLEQTLDRSAWPLSQAFYLPSCPAESRDESFHIHNQGEALPVDVFVARGMEALAARGRRSLSLRAMPDSGLVLGTAQNNAPAETAENVARLNDALRSLDPGVKRPEWLRVIWSVAAHGWMCAYEIAREWSSRSPTNFEPHTFDKDYASYDPTHSDAIHAGTVYFLARQAGWTVQQETGRDPGAESNLPPTSDTHNAIRLATALAGQVAYRSAIDSWAVWNGRRWTTDRSGELVALAQRTLRGIASEVNVALNAGQEKKAQRLFSWALQSLNQSRLLAAIDLLKAQPGFTVAEHEWDSDPLRIQTIDGWVVDLRTGKARRAQSTDYMLRTVGCGWDPSAGCPTWLLTLAQVFEGDQDMIDFIQLLAGYCLTGRTDEQKFFFFYGTGANGKSLILNTLRKLLDEYSLQTMPEALMVQRNPNPGAASPHLARMAGVRMVVANETGEGQRLDEAMIKQMTGGDAITARHPYGQEFQYVPEFKLIMAGNYKPVIRGDDYAIWRRVELVPFRKQFAPEDQDRCLDRKLEAELPGILCWALAGAVRWQQQGLVVPAVIRRETDAYRSDMDLVQQWIDEVCIVGPDHSYDVGAAYFSFRYFLQDSGSGVPTKRRFSEKLKSRGIQSEKGPKGVRRYVGMGPRTHESLMVKVAQVAQP